MSYFTIQVNAKDEAELNKRIADNESRGFELVKIDNVSSFGNVWSDISGINQYRQRFEFKGTEERKSFRAIMRRANKERTV